jgi:pimeloyl-ACP methyl ester carboxylesterase
MRRLGYTRWVAQGGDWGSLVATAIDVMKPDDCTAIHVNMPLVFPEPDQLQDMDAFEQAAVASLAHWQEPGKPRGRPDPGRDAGQHHALLAAGQRHRLGPAVLGERGQRRTDQTGQRRIDQTRASRRRQHISARDQPPLAALGRPVDAKPDPLQHPGPGGPLRRLGAASAAR